MCTKALALAALCLGGTAAAHDGQHAKPTERPEIKSGQELGETEGACLKASRKGVAVTYSREDAHVGNCPPKASITISKTVRF